MPATSQETSELHQGSLLIVSFLDETTELSSSIKLDKIGSDCDEEVYSSDQQLDQDLLDRNETDQRRTEALEHIDRIKRTYHRQ